MNKDEIQVGDTVADSPRGAGKVTSITERGFPRVDEVAVAWLIRTDGAVFDPYNKHGGSKPGTGEDSEQQQTATSA